jgi:hypothetical protein
MSFDYQGTSVTIQRQNPSSFACTIVELTLLHESATLPPSVQAEVKQILEEYQSVFAGAQPVNKKPYRYTPQLKTEIERPQD